MKNLKKQKEKENRQWPLQRKSLLWGVRAYKEKNIQNTTNISKETASGNSAMSMNNMKQTKHNKGKETNEVYGTLNEILEIGI